ncbi:hypothetical protein F0U59_26795 [Archangium gephyra]|nr:hypothetical protein F0U59_26795 [Archangium gephyra]
MSYVFDKDTDEFVRKPKASEDPNTRHSRSVRLFNHEWSTVKEAAARTSEGALEEASNRGRWWREEPAPPLTFMRAVVMDWAKYLTVLPKKDTARLPSVVVRDLAARVARLEAYLRARGVDPDAVGEEATSAGSPPHKRRAAGGGA